MENQTIIEDTIGGMDSAYEELRLKLIPVMHNKIKIVNGKLLKDCFKLIGRILNAHQILSEYYNSEFVQIANEEEENEQ